MSERAPTIPELSEGILAGVRVVELAQNAAVPHCGRLLAGLGADVVKVEPPEGDAVRHIATVAENEGKAYAVINPGKRGVVVDLRRLGEHTVEVMSDVGLDDDAVNRLVREGVILDGRVSS